MEQHDPFRTALELHRAGRSAEAERFYREALSSNPARPDAHVLLAAIAQEQGRIDEAIDLLRRACELAPDFPEAHYQLGLSLRRAGQSRDAIAALEQALRRKPELFEAWYELGGALLEDGRTEPARQAFSNALMLRPDSPETACSLAGAMCVLGRWDEARELYERSLHLRPDLFESRLGVATVLRGQGRAREAVEAYTACVREKPDNVQALRGVALSLFDQGRSDESLEAFEELGRRHPADPSVRYELGCELLLRGQFGRGWPLYEQRWKVPRLTPLVPGPFPAWDGADLRGKRILLHHEQGNGDTLQFVRYVTMPAFRDARVVLRCQKALYPLLKGQFDVETIVADGEALPEGIDCHCTLTSLPAKFRTEEATIPANVPYIRPAPETVAAWREKLGARHSAMRVGVVWAGNPAHPRDRRRSMDPQPLFEMAASLGADVEWYSLQKSEGRTATQSNPAGFQLIDFTSELADFAQTAGLMSQLDLVLTVDTSVAHLAGAMGMPVWVMLPFMPDWRWQLGRNDSRWYPTMLLFRQPRLDDWPAVIEEVAKSLRHKIGSPTAT